MNTLMGYCGPFTSETGYCQRLKAFITTNLQWVQEQIETQPSSPYWYQVLSKTDKVPCTGAAVLKGPKQHVELSVSACQVRLALLQLKGLEDSYNDELSLPVGSFSLNPFGFL